MHGRFLLVCAAPFCAVAVACAGCVDEGPAERATQQQLAICPMVDASACQSPIPSYANDVAPLLNRACNNDTCHSANAEQWPLTDWQSILDWKDLIVHDTEYCTMPPQDAGTGTLTNEERKMLLDWFACGAPNN